jgi:hypothetical protein
MVTQSCPHCGRSHDVAVYVSGQRILCECGIKFEVKRTDAITVPPSRRVIAAGAEGAAVASQPAAGKPRPAMAVVPPLGGDARNSAAANSNLAEQTFIGTTPAPGIEIPGFELTDLLGRGGMGEVWRARQKSLGRTVAVKLLPVDLAGDAEFVARFEKESAALAALSHPHIIQIIDRGVAGPHYYFVMEFVEGKSLRELINRGRPSPQQSLRLISQILLAMECAHETHIIHRDLKPENILVDPRGHAKVADFGLAGMRGGEGQSHLTATSVAMGTVNYMAPEQRRDAAHVDGRADLYSVGVILYELLTGELPFGRFRLPSERVPGLDPRLDAVVERLLQQEPTHRYPTATDALGELEPLLSASSSTAPTRPSGALSRGGPALTERASVIARGARGLRMALMVIGGLAVLAIGARWIFGPQSVPKLTISAGGRDIVLDSERGANTSGENAPGTKLAHAGNTYGEVMSSIEEEPLAGGRVRLKLSFDTGDEELNVHSGEWQLADGKLRAIQAGNDTEGQRLVPRAYVAHRYFSTDDFEAEVDLTLRDVRDRYEVGDEVQRFAELALRIKDLQVSAFAIPGVGMRLGWRYHTPDGAEVAGNSARDLELLVEDEMPTPPDGSPFRLRLQLRRAKDAVSVIASVNGHTFARKMMPGLRGQVGKVAVGCRNYECAFDDLVVTGKAAERPAPRAAGSAAD